MKRNTTQRMTIEEIFKQADHPLGVQEILEVGKGRVPSLNLATVYRNLKLLLAEGRLNIISHPVLGILYERAGKAHHHHFHCRICDRVFELPGCPLKETVPCPPGFVAEAHEVYLFGVCAVCGARTA